MGRLGRALSVDRQDYNVCFVDDREIERLNFIYRGKKSSTDVLSFPWSAKQDPRRPRDRSGRLGHKKARRGAVDRIGEEFKNFLGDIVISVETARRNARQEGHSTLNEVRWLILHGLLHLLGYDHESDSGEMTKLELRLRSRLGISGD